MFLDVMLKRKQPKYYFEISIAIVCWNAWKYKKEIKWFGFDETFSQVFFEISLVWWKEQNQSFLTEFLFLSKVLGRRVLMGLIGEILFLVLFVFKALQVIFSSFAIENVYVISSLPWKAEPAIHQPLCSLWQTEIHFVWKPWFRRTVWTKYTVKSEK